MKTPRRNRVAELRKKAGLTQQQLAEAVGSHWVTISRLERGIVRLSYEWAERLSGPLKTDLAELVLPDKEIAQARFVGCVGSNGIVEHFDEQEIYFRPAMRSFFNAPDSEWLEIEGIEENNFVRSGDVILIDYLAEDEAPLLERLNGRLCVARVKEGDSYLCILGLTGEKDIFNLQLLSGPPIKNVRLSSLARVSCALFVDEMEEEQNSQ